MPTAGEVARSIEGIRAAAGGWKDVDAEALKASSDSSVAPPVGRPSGCEPVPRGH